MLMMLFADVPFSAVDINTCSADVDIEILLLAILMLTLKSVPFKLLRYFTTEMIDKHTNSSIIAPF